MVRREEGSCIMLTSKEGISVPICVTGIVTRIEVDFCQDGAKYRVTSTVGDHRVKPRTSAVDAELARVAGSRMNIGVCGDIRHSAECVYLDAYWAGLPDRLTELSGEMSEAAS